MKYFVIYQPDKYIEDCGVKVKDCVDYIAVNEFLTNFLTTNSEGKILWIIRGELLEWETYEMQVKARIKII